MKVNTFPIGYKFIITRGKKRRDIETIVDILTTTNIKGEVVKVEYVAVHDFMGQQLRSTHIETTILMAKKVQPEPEKAILEAMDRVDSGVDELLLSSRAYLNKKRSCRR